MDVLIAVFAFLGAIIILVSVHEFGHFLVARICGVKVLNFAIGFGKSIYKISTPQTIYHLKVIPLGGFVDMLDSKKHKLNKDNQHQAFDKQSVYRRSLIVLAGPLFNILLAILIYTIIAFIGFNDLRPTIGSIVANSPAQRAGLEIGQTFSSINNTPILGAKMVLSTFLSNQTEFNIITIDSDQQTKQHRLILNDNWLDETDTGIDDRLGFKFAYPKLPAIIAKVNDGSAAAKAQIEVGDEIIGIDGNEISNWPELLQKIKAIKTSEPIVLRIKRDEYTLITNIEPQIINNEAKFGIQAKVSNNFSKDYQVFVHYPLHQALYYGINRSYELMLLNFKMIVRIISGNASVKHLSGPITIANYAGQSLTISLPAFLNFLALLSLAIAFFNLLPIPMLDGGHLFLYFVEIVKRGPLSMKLQQFFSYIGALLLALLIAVAVYNDFIRLVG